MALNGGEGAKCVCAASIEMHFVISLFRRWPHSLVSVLYTLEHAHRRPACPPDLSHTHPRNYGERTGRCQRGETGAVFLPASGR